MSRSPRAWFRRRKRWIGPLCGLIAVFLAVGCAGPGDRPNVLLVTLDTTRADRLGCYGYPQAVTPTIDRLATEGVRFVRTYAQAPLTLPSHVSLMTGSFPEVHGIHVNAEGRVPGGLPILAEQLADDGYATAAFVSSFVLDSVFGLDRGFEHYDDRMGDDRPSTRFQAERRADVTTDAAIGWLKARDDRPFFAWVHYYDPHTPYAPPASFASVGSDAYDSEIGFVDQQLGRIVSWLESIGERERTLIVVIGDHGESLGEHGEPEHGLFVYDATMRVPFVMSWPDGLPQGVVIDEAAQVIDLFPTLLDLTGRRGRGHGDGQSLMPAIEGLSEPRVVMGESLYGAIGFDWAPLQFIVEGHRKFIDAPEQELYDLRDDPGETRNLAPALPGDAARMAAALREWRSELVPHDTEAVDLDAEARAKLESLGYVGATAGGSGPRSGRPDPKKMIHVLREYLRANALLTAGRFAEAASRLERLVAESPESSDFYEDLGFAYLGLGRNADAERAYARSLVNLPQHAERLWGLGEALRRQEKWREAIAVYDHALVQRPTMGEIHQGLALAYAGLGEPGQALAHAERHLEINGAAVVAWGNVARLASETGDFERAIEAGERLMVLSPDDPQTHLTWWNTLNAAGEREREVEALRQTLQRFPDDWMFVSLLGWRLAVSPESDRAAHEEAVKLGQRAVTLNPDHPRSHDVLAAARAATGSFTEAVSQARIALELSKGLGLPDLRDEIGDRLRLYESGEPYQE